MTTKTAPKKQNELKWFVMSQKATRESVESYADEFFVWMNELGNSVGKVLENIWNVQNGRKSEIRYQRVALNVDLFMEAYRALLDDNYTGPVSVMIHEDMVRKFTKDMEFGFGVFANLINAMELVNQKPPIASGAGALLAGLNAFANEMALYDEEETDKAYAATLAFVTYTTILGLVRKKRIDVKIEKGKTHSTDKTVRH